MSNAAATRGAAVLGARRPRVTSVLLTTIAAILALILSAAPGSAARAAGPDLPRATAPTCAPDVEFLGFSDALNKRQFAGTNVGGLSGLVYDRQREVYYSLVDNEAATPARFYTLRLPLDRDWLDEPAILDVTILRDRDGQPFTGQNFDGEGIVLTGRGELLIASETEPAIRRFARDGALLGELPVPDRFRVAPAGEAGRNLTFESLALSPNGRSLFTAVEGPLAPDGSVTGGSGRIRILRYEDRGPGGFVPVEQFFYLTEAGRGIGVVEIVALSERELLVLERGFAAGEGNTVRVFQVALAGARDVAAEASLAAPRLTPIRKSLLVDLANCPPSGAATAPGATQPNPLLDNVESLALGPRLPGGRRALLLQSDDNFGANQTTRVIALAVRLQPDAAASAARGGRGWEE